MDSFENFKYLWHKISKYVIGCIILIIIIYIVNVFINLKQEHNMVETSVIYSKFKVALSTQNESEVIRLSQQLESGNTEYASLASLFAAHFLYQNHNITEATVFLNWVIHNATDIGLVSTARLSLADIFIDQKQFDQALQLLLQPHPISFNTSYYIKRGDLYLAQNKILQATDAYKQALQNVAPNSQIAQLIQVRLSVLGTN